MTDTQTKTPPGGLDPDHLRPGDVITREYGGLAGHTPDLWTSFSCYWRVSGRAGPWVELVAANCTRKLQNIEEWSGLIAEIQRDGHKLCEHCGR